MTEQSECTPLFINTNNVVKKEMDFLQSPAKGGEFSFKSVSRRKKFIFISMAFARFCAACCFSLLAPFFPIEAEHKGVSQTVVGFIFGGFKLMMFLSSPVFGNYMSQIGCKFMFVSGVMVCGSCAILFGTLVRCPNGIIFIVMCFSCRTIEALGASAYVTSLFAILFHEFPGNLMTVIGTIEIFSGLGLMAGPAIGGALYELGGFGLPFYVIGSVVIVIGFVTSMVMPAIPSGSKMYKGSVLTLMRSPMVLVTFINIVACSISLGFLDPTLANHLTQFQLQTWVVGLIFLIAPAVYAVTAPFWGIMGDRMGFVRLMIGGGGLMSIIPELLLGPAPFISSFVPNKLYVNIIALALIGLTVGCVLIPSFKGLIKGANSLGMPNNLETFGKASGIYNSAFSLGAFLGPTIGGTMVENFGFGWSTAGIAGIFGVAGGLMLLHLCTVKDLSDMSEEATAERSLESTDEVNKDQSTNSVNYSAIDNI